MTKRYSPHLICLLFLLIMHVFSSGQSRPQDSLPFNFKEFKLQNDDLKRQPIGMVDGDLLLMDTTGGKRSLLTIDFETGQTSWLDSTVANNFCKTKNTYFPVPSGIMSVNTLNESLTFILLQKGMSGSIIFRNFPAIPKAISPSDLCESDGVFYLLGANCKGFIEVYKLNINKNDSQWNILPNPPTSFALKNRAQITIQGNGVGEVLYLITDKSISYFNYDKNNWVNVAQGVSEMNIIDVCNVGNMHILVSSIPEFNSKGMSSTKYSLFNTITNEWIHVDLPEYADFVPKSSYIVKEKLVLLGKNGNVLIGEPKVKKYLFSKLDIALFIFYFALLVVIGYYFSKRAKTTEDYFRVKKKIPWWAAGISILATKLSAVTFLSLPVKAFATDWMYFWLPVGNILLAVFVIKYILPFYSKLNVTTSFEYLEKRFNISIRTLGAYTYIISEIAKTGVIILIPSIVISVVTGIDIFLCIALIGGIVVVYTFLGGIEAVIWIDVIQVIVMLGGVIAALIIVGINLDVFNMYALFKPVLHTYKINLLDLKFDFTRATFIVIVLSWVGKIQDYVSNQAVVQKLVTTKDFKSTKKATWTACLLNIPVNFLFLVMGTGLFLFYKSNPGNLDPLLPMPDALFITYIVAEMPHGLIALVVAGVFAAAMSTLAGSINSMSTTYVTNILKHRKKQIDDKKLLLIAKLLIVLFGFFVTMSALLVAIFEIKSLYDLVFMVIGLFGGGLAGLFILGMFTQKGNSAGAVVGFIMSSVILFFVSTVTDLNLFLYAPIGILSCLVFGYLASSLFPNSTKNIKDLTVYKT